MFPYPVDNAIMISVGCVLCFLAIKKGYEPLLLLPIGFGAIIVNMPNSELMESGGFLRIRYDYGILTELFPILIFIGIGTMADFGPLLERPWLMIFSAAGQLGIFVALLAALSLGFSPPEASSIAIIGAMDGPTAIYVTSQFAPSILGAVVVCAYSYMSLVPIFQIPISRALTTRKERTIRMPYASGIYPKHIRLIFPLIVVAITAVVAPKGLPLMSALMLGNFMRESGAVDRLLKTTENEMTNIVTLLLGITIGGTMVAEQFLKVQTLIVFGIGIVAFVSAISCGILFAKAVCFLTRGKINPLIGGAGTSAFPMAARTAHRIGREDDPDNWLLMHALAANTGGQIGSVIAGAVILTYAPQIAGF